MIRYVWTISARRQLWQFATEWALINHPDYKRGALRCKTQALINEDRIFTNTHGI